MAILVSAVLVLSCIQTKNHTQRRMIVIGTRLYTVGVSNYVHEILQHSFHTMKVTKSFKLDVRKFSFSNRVVNEWNGLSEEIIQSKSLAGFKKRIDYHLGYIRGFI